MRITIERIRTAVLIAGVLLLIALGVFLTIGRWRSPFNRRDLPKKLGIDIRQEENGFTQAAFSAAHAKFKITASKVEQLKDNRVRLHIVKIEMYDPKSGAADRIEGSEFEYDQQSGVAKAAGPVEITLNRPKDSTAPRKPNQPVKKPGRAKAASAPAAPPSNDQNQIHVRTSGLTFDQSSGVASTSEHVDFDLAEGSGSSMGASYNSQNGTLVLDRAVELDARRGADPIHLQAQHAEFNRDTNVCRLQSAIARFRNGGARTADASVLFRDDGTAIQLDASHGLELTTANGGHLAAPTGHLEFDDDNQPRVGHLEGGVLIDSDRDGSTLHGSAPTADLQFDENGLLRQAHLERNVHFVSHRDTDSARGLLHVQRDWTSPVADLTFREIDKGQLALDSIHGTGGVVVMSESHGPQDTVASARMSADDVKGSFGPDSALSAMIGTGHARMEQTSTTGTRQTTSGDRLEVHFDTRRRDNTPPANQKAGSPVGGSEIESATVTGNVVLFQQPAAKSGAGEPPALQATAARADYEGSGQWLHLTGNPRVENGGLQLTADKIDVARASDDAFAHGNVKATWFGDTAKPGSKPEPHATKEPGFGGQGPAHIVAAEAQLHQQTGEATFRGNVRLWQQANSVAAPVLVLDRTKETLVARTANPAEPVRVVLLSSSTVGQGKSGKSDTPSVVRVRGGDLKYSDAERKAWMKGGVVGAAVAETGDATIRSSELEITLLPPGNHAARDGGSAQVDTMTARGQVAVVSQGRQGTGEQLAYSSQSGEYVLTGTAASPPRMTDPTRGTVTGGALRFNSRDDSVNVEGDGRETTTDTTVPKRQ